MRTEEQLHHDWLREQNILDEFPRMPRHTMDNSIIAEYKSLKVQIEVLESCQKELKAELLPVVEAAGGKLVADNGKATIIAASERVSFDADKLSALMERPEYSWLAKYRKVSQVAEQLRIT